MINKIENLYVILYRDACTIIEQAQREAYRQVNEILIKRNWLLGMRIQHDVLKDKRAEYGKQVVKNLSKSLMERYGNGFQPANIYHFITFFDYHPDIFYAASRKSETVPSLTGESEIMNEMCSQSSIADFLQSLTAKDPIRLTWTHYRIILQESNKEARNWYEQEAAREMWSTRTLLRNVSSQYYHRLLQSQNKEAVHNEMRKLTSPLQDKLYYLKNPVVAEFLGFKNKTDYIESKLEDSLQLTPQELEGREREAVIRQRVNQSVFRTMVLSNYEERCAITGINIPELLVAGHSIPWADSNSQQKVDPENGICLSALYDKAFDRGFITISPDDYTIRLSDALRDYETQDYFDRHFGVISGQKITMPIEHRPNRDFLAYHRDHVFVA